MFYECLNTPRYKRFWALDREVNDVYINILFNMQSTVDHNNVVFFLQKSTKNIYVYTLIANLFLCIHQVVFLYCNLIWATTIFHLSLTNVKTLPWRCFVIKKTFLFSGTCHLVMVCTFRSYSFPLLLHHPLLVRTTIKIDTIGQFLRITCSKMFLWSGVRVWNLNSPSSLHSVANCTFKQTPTRHFDLVLAYESEIL